MLFCKSREFAANISPGAEHTHKGIHISLRGLVGIYQLAEQVVERLFAVSPFYIRFLILNVAGNCREAEQQRCCK